MQRAPLFLLLSVCLISVWGFSHYDVGNTEIIQGDGYGYYSYLPAWFEYGDVYFEFFDDLDETEKSHYWLYPHEGGRAIPKMTMALAIYWTPFYLLASIVSPVLGFPANGWSQPYQMAIWLAAIIALFAGLWNLWIVLKRRFSRTASYITILLIVLGTNLLHYSLKESSMSHVYSFAAISIFIRFWDDWRISKKYSWLIWLAIILAFITLIRPTNIIVGILPLITLVRSEAHRNQLFQPKSILLPIVSLMVFLPQMFVWHQVTGDWLYYSYPGEAFFWTRPHIIDGLFSFRNGWLLYTPIMVFAVLGIPLLRRIDREMMWSVSIIFLIHIYIVFSWWCWYYGDSLSIRPMIDIYALLAIPFCASIAWFLRQRMWLIALATITILFTLAFNLIADRQYIRQQISGSAMTRLAFEELFFHPDYEGDLEMAGAYRYPDTQQLRAGKNERTSMDTILTEPSYDTLFTPSVLVSEKEYYSPAWQIPYDDLSTPQDEDIILVQLDVEGDKNNYADARIVASFEMGGKVYDYRQVRLGVKKDQTYFLRKPRDIPDGGVLKLYLWQKSEGSFILNGMKLTQAQIRYSKQN